MLTEFWTPKDTLYDRARVDRVPYDVWERDGHIHAPPGTAIDYGFVAKRMPLPPWNVCEGEFPVHRYR